MEDENSLPEVPPRTIANIPGTDNSAEFDSSEHPDVEFYFSSSQVLKPPRPSKNKASSSKSSSEHGRDGDDYPVNNDDSSNDSSNDSWKSALRSDPVFINHKPPRPHSGVVSLPSLDFHELAQKYSEQFGEIQSLIRERDALKNDLLAGEVNIEKLEVDLTGTNFAKNTVEAARLRAENAFDDLQSSNYKISTRNGELEEMNKILRTDCVTEKKRSQTLQQLNLSLVGQVANHVADVTAKDRRIQALLEEMASMRVELEIARREILRFDEMQKQLEKELWLADEGQKKKKESQSETETLGSRIVEVGSQNIWNRNIFDTKALSGLADRLDMGRASWAHSSIESDTRPQSSSYISLKNMQGLYLMRTDATLAEELGDKQEDGEIELTESPISYVDANTHPGERQDTFTETLPATAYVSTSLQTKSGPQETERRKQPVIRYVESGVQTSPRKFFVSTSKPTTKSSVPSITNEGHLPGLTPEVTPTELFYRDNTIPTISISPKERFKSITSHGSSADGDVQDVLGMLSEFSDRATSSTHEPSLADWGRAAFSKAQKDTWISSITKRLAKRTGEQSSPSPQQSRGSSGASKSSGTISKPCITSFLDKFWVPEPKLHHCKPEFTVRDYAFERPDLSERGRGYASSPESRSYPQTEPQPTTWEERLANISAAPISSDATTPILEQCGPKTNAFSYFWQPIAAPRESAPWTEYWRLTLLILAAVYILSHCFFAERRFWRDANELTRWAVVAMRDERWGGPVWVDKMVYTVDEMFGLRSDSEGWGFG